MVILSSKAGEIPLMWEDKKEILLADLNSEAFAGQINRLLDEPELAEKLAQNAYLKAETYGWKHIQKKWLNFLLRKSINIL